MHTGDASALGAVALDEGAGAVAFKINANAHRLQNRKHFGNASSHFSGATAAAKGNRLGNRVTASNSITNTRPSNRSRANSARSANLSRSKSLRRVFTSAL